MFHLHVLNDTVTACPGLNIILAVVQLKRAISLPHILCSVFLQGRSALSTNMAEKLAICLLSILVRPASAAPCPWRRPRSWKWCSGWISWQKMDGELSLHMFAHKTFKNKSVRQFVQRIRCLLQIILRFKPKNTNFIQPLQWIWRTPTSDLDIWGLCPEFCDFCLNLGQVLVVSSRNSVKCREPQANSNELQLSPAL